MGKRKYNDNSEAVSKRCKSEKGLKNYDENEDTQPQSSEDQKEDVSKVYKFNIKHFRKELAVKQGQTMILTQFLQVCLNPDKEVDYIEEYLKSGGNSHEILRQINQESKKNLTLATPAFHIFHLIILKVQSSMPHLITATEEACRYFLNTFMSTVEIMISENSGPRHRKVILKLLTSMVTLNADLGIEVLNQAPLTPKQLQYIVEKTNLKEKDDVRTSFVHFMTSFLVDGHLPLIKALLEKQGLLALVIPGLVNDEAEAVLIFLNILKKNVIDNPVITKSLKLKTFSHQMLHNLFKIYSWKGPSQISHDLRNEMRSDISNLLSEIILTLFTSHKLGLYFIDKSLGTGDANKNQNLYRAILTLNRPWEIQEQGEVIITIVTKCPDLHRAIINTIEKCYEPNHSPIWERTVEFLLKLLDRLKPEDLLNRMTALSPTQTANFIRFMTLPVPLLKFTNASLDKDRLLSIYCIKVLVRLLESLKRYISILETDDSQARITELRNKLEYFFPKHLPAPRAIVSLIQNIIDEKTTPDNVTSNNYKLPDIDVTKSLTYLIDLLLLYNDIHPAFFETVEGTLDMKKILDYTKNLTDDRISVLKFKVVSLWLMLDSSAISVKNPMFKNLFVIMLEVYTSDKDSTWIEAEDTLHKFLRNTGIFEGDEDEIYLMLYTLRHSTVDQISTIANIVEYILNNLKQLSDMIRNQIVHFEISDSVSEANLDKLLNDLTENKNTDNSAFVETKMPSPFIVGCIQYIQDNKHCKKPLKQFLSLYVANLLHTNYSPELTEVLIGDCKLDVRNYVASWIGEPTALIESIVEKDETLKKLSKSILIDEEILVQDIFPNITICSSDDSDIMVNEVHFKITNAKNVDGAEMLIWAKYLIFCLIRLTTIKKLNEINQKKVLNYFNILIAVAKKNHMITFCRSMLLSLCKNAHFLKIYEPLDMKNNESSVLATNFFTKLIVEHSDLISYLNKHNKLLKPYQQKNYNGIVKAFIKIKKKNNIGSDLTVSVLEAVGLSKEDDLRVLTQIVSKDVNVFVKDDKEPSIVLDILCVLVDKYSKTVEFELSPNIVKNVIKLYTNLLTNKDFCTNLTNIENSLTQYFENKPNQVKHLAEDHFNQFFNASSIRKSTSQLASVLLRINYKFCNICKEQITKPDILSQREITLPLCSAIIHHKQFLKENKDFLNLVYGEYKSNIIKLLEKPHKAGQIYISCWSFVRKLIIECMDFEDCQKIFNKIHKYEVADHAHINLLHAVLLKLCLRDEGYKLEHLINYFFNILVIITLALKDGKDDNLICDTIYQVNNVLRLSETKSGVNISQKEDFKKITESAIWQNFCKAILKESLKLKRADQENMSGPYLLNLLTQLVKIFYTNNHEDIVMLFDMVTSHSEFLNVMLSYHSSNIKYRLIEFIFLLIRKNESVMKSQQIPVYLSAYHAKKSPCDRLLLNILHFYETRGQPVNEYKPYVWGDSAANFYAVRKNRNSSLWSYPTQNQVINLFDKDTIQRTIKRFPVLQKLEYNYEISSQDTKHLTTDSPKLVLERMWNDCVFKTQPNKDLEAEIDKLILHSTYNDNFRELIEKDLKPVSHLKDEYDIYDPAFLFPLLSHLLAPGSVASCFRLLRSGLLSVPVMALSSKCPSMRAAAYHVLHRFSMLLETESRHKNDKLLLSDFMETLRQSLMRAGNVVQNGEYGVDANNPRLPAIDALYLARALRTSTAPFDPLYKPVNNFFIAKQVVDLTVVPDFLNLFHDSDVEFVERRLWILDIIRDGTKTIADVNVIFKSMSLKMIMDFYSSVLCDKKTKQKILNVMNSLVAIPRAFEILVEGYGLVSWLHSVTRFIGRGDKTLVHALFSVLKSMQESLLINSFSKCIANTKNGKTLELFGEIKVNKEVENEIFILYCDLLNHLYDFELQEVSPLVENIKLFSSNTVIQAKKQMPCLVSTIGSFIKDDDKINIILKALKTNDVRLLKSGLLVSNNNNLESGTLLNCLISIIEICFV